MKKEHGGMCMAVFLGPGLEATHSVHIHCQRFCLATLNYPPLSLTYEVISLSQLFTQVKQRVENCAV